MRGGGERERNEISSGRDNYIKTPCLLQVVVSLGRIRGYRWASLVAKGTGPQAGRLVARLQLGWGRTKEAGTWN